MTILASRNCCMVEAVERTERCGLLGTTQAGFSSDVDIYFRS